MRRRFASVYDPGDALITARFPVVAADIATDAVTTIKIANDAVTSPKAATGVVDGDTVTGAVLQTASSGERVVIRNDGSGGIIESFSGVASEILPSVLDPSDDGSGVPILTLRTGTKTGATEKASISLKAGAADASRVSAVAKTFAIEGPLATDCTLAITGHATFTGTGWQNVSFAATWSNFGGTFQTGQYKRVGNKVTLRGTVQSSAPTTPSTIFTLPAGYRVAANKTRIFPTVGAGAFAAMGVASSGVVSFDAGNATYLSLDGIEFDID